MSNHKIFFMEYDSKLTKNQLLIQILWVMQFRYFRIFFISILLFQEKKFVFNTWSTLLTSDIVSESKLVTQINQLLSQIFFDISLFDSDWLKTKFNENEYFL